MIVRAHSAVCVLRAKSRVKVRAFKAFSTHWAVSWGFCELPDCIVVANPLPIAPDGPVEWQDHEGMVTVYDTDGHYQGCMGIESWRILLAEGEARW